MKCKICGEELTHMEGNYYFAHKHREINPEYRRLAQIAYDTVLQTMIEGEKTHPDNEWKDRSVKYHKEHAFIHAGNAHLEPNKTDEDNIACCMTRCAMIKFLEDK